MNKAKEIVKLKGWRGDARVFELNPPVEYEDFDDDNGGHVPAITQYVIVSTAVVPMSGPETYIFPARKEGDVFDTVNMLEMEGSFQGSLDHAKALEGLGYAIEA